MAHEGVTYTTLAPAMIQACLASPALVETPPDRLRIIVYGGSPIAPATLDEARARIGCAFRAMLWPHRNDRPRHDPDAGGSCARTRSAALLRGARRRASKLPWSMPKGRPLARRRRNRRDHRARSRRHGGLCRRRRRNRRDGSRRLGSTAAMLAMSMPRAMCSYRDRGEGHDRFGGREYLPGRGRKGAGRSPACRRRRSDRNSRRKMGRDGAGH